MDIPVSTSASQAPRQPKRRKARSPRKSPSPPSSQSSPSQSPPSQSPPSHSPLQAQSSSPPSSEASAQRRKRQISTAACLHCQSHHRACGIERPCYHCIRLGLTCTEGKQRAKTNKKRSNRETPSASGNLSSSDNSSPPSSEIPSPPFEGAFLPSSTLLAFSLPTVSYSAPSVIDLSPSSSIDSFPSFTASISPSCAPTVPSYSSAVPPFSSVPSSSPTDLLPSAPTTLDLLDPSFSAHIDAPPRSPFNNTLSFIEEILFPSSSFPPSPPTFEPSLSMPTLPSPSSSPDHQTQYSSSYQQTVENPERPLLITTIATAMFRLPDGALLDSTRSLRELLKWGRNISNFDEITPPEQHAAMHMERRRLIQDKQSFMNKVGFKTLVCGDGKVTTFMSCCLLIHMDTYAVLQSTIWNTGCQ